MILSKMQHVWSSFICFKQMSMISGRYGYISQIQERQKAPPPLARVSPFIPPVRDAASYFGFIFSSHISYFFPSFFTASYNLNASLKLSGLFALYHGSSISTCLFMIEKNLFLSTFIFNYKLSCKRSKWRALTVTSAVNHCSCWRHWKHASFTAQIWQ